MPLLEGGDDSSEVTRESTANSILGFLSDLFFTLLKGVKILLTIGIVIYCWTQTCVTRTEQFGIVHELSKEGWVKITYHHDRVSSDSSFEHRNNGESDQHENEVAPPKSIEDSLKVEAGDYMAQIVTDQQYLEQNPGYVDTDGNSKLHLSEDVIQATKTLIGAEIGDKTFCLIIIFTISWANWNSVSSQDYIELDKKKIDTKVKNSVNPIRVYLASTFATCFVTVVTNLY